MSATIYRVTYADSTMCHTAYKPLADVWVKRKGSKLEEITLAEPPKLRSIPASVETAELLKSIAELTGEANTLAGILCDCYVVLETIVPDDSDEAERLSDLRMAITYALDPYKREGTLL